MDTAPVWIGIDVAKDQLDIVVGGDGDTWSVSQHAVLYMAAFVGARPNPVIRPLYTRLCEAGEPPKPALVACAHKLLTILNAMARTGEPWRAERA